MPLWKMAKPIMLIESKAAGNVSAEQDAAQLSRHFITTDQSGAMLTNGVVYRFYSDLDRPRRVDNTPFLEVRRLEFEDAPVEDLK